MSSFGGGWDPLKPSPTPHRVVPRTKKVDYVLFQPVVVLSVTRSKFKFRRSPTKNGRVRLGVANKISVIIALGLLDIYETTRQCGSVLYYLVTKEFGPAPGRGLCFRFSPNNVTARAGSHRVRYHWYRRSYTTLSPVIGDLINSRTVTHTIGAVASARRRAVSNYKKCCTVLNFVVFRRILLATSFLSCRGT